MRKASLSSTTSFFLRASIRFIATTSKLMTTGVDAQTCKLIVLDQRIQSMTEFKQIIGRGTRINEDYGKFFFTIMDFKRATELFADPAFDGDPYRFTSLKEMPRQSRLILQKTQHQKRTVLSSLTLPAPESDLAWTDGPETSGFEETGRPHRYVVGNVPVEVLAERVQYFDANGKLITESLKEYTRKAISQRVRLAE